ncbi:class I SAM-dependent methyltransferase [Amycolatopsis keratiniphila]|uniref:SAM-dependent methyltransferase n=1 Tax=Amycolatopsis keratiniphila subsp. keratiniphila TaxID=227715 RepID=A0A1W2M340_9PSEU|nr:class I SAM-dependent methyltransferase [Amycolatopsis keratiniphila]ONF74400.1 SAM-dependent methyltransferase [Amycolatopsis keratiniphila subsp. keratiniphila]
MTALRRWADALASWAIPPEILAAAPESPWVLPRQVFERRADTQIAAPTGATHSAARAALAEPGSVLDVGAAAGATSLPLAGRAPVLELTAVDADEALLAGFATRAAGLGLPATVLCGRWPELADETPVADVVVCGNVVYNVADLAPFVHALTGHARRRVIVEVAAAHPLIELNPLWRRFHGIDRPTGPTAEDFLTTLSELGIEPTAVRWRRHPEAEYATFTELTDITRRRLCLPADAEPEVAAALRALGVDPAMPPDLGSSGRDLVTVSWPGQGI